MELTLRKCMRYIAKFWWILAMAVVLGGIVGFIVSRFDSGMYQASGTIKVEFDYEKIDSNSDGYATFRTTSVNNVIQTIRTRDFLVEQFDSAGAQELYTSTKTGSTVKDVLEYITVTQNDSSDFITVSCRTENKNWSIKIVEGIIDSISADTANQDIYCVVTSKAALIDEVVPSWITSMLIGLGLGLIVGIVGLLIARAFDTRILEESDVSDNFEITLLGNLSEVDK